MKKTILPLLLMSIGAYACFYVAPVEEEDDELPYINQNAVTPTPGVVEIELGDDAPMNITLSAYGDENKQQTLYHRVVMDLRPAGEYRIIATEPRIVTPGSRDRIKYQFRPCAMFSAYTGVIADGKTIDMYFLLSDQRFMSDSEISISKEGEFQQPFKTNPEKRSVYVQWSVVFEGACRDAKD